ncbi:MAG TPA: DUF3108 domain-containing protein [Thermoanaerobaculia bacterium]|nr:DUF3108 domain-containing protein [Thermoanaerobaculia bacterium]
MALCLSPALVHAADVNCKAGASNVEEFRYSWRIRGALRFIAGLIIPTSGVGNYKTTYPQAASGDHSINSELLITPGNGEQGFFAYESQMDEAGQQTEMTYSGYAWGNKTRKVRTVFDYVKRLARIHKETPKGIENTVKPMPSAENMRDVLTAIYFLRQNASKINGPIVTKIFTDGQEYPATLKPGERRTFTIDGKVTPARAFEIGDAPGGKKWPGGVKVWLSEDERRIPCRIEIAESFASLQLDLQSIEACAFLKAEK